MIKKRQDYVDNRPHLREWTSFAEKMCVKPPSWLKSNLLIFFIVKPFLFFLLHKCTSYIPIHVKKKKLFTIYLCNSST